MISSPSRRLVSSTLLRSYPVYDFLAPSILICRGRRRHASTTVPAVALEDASPAGDRTQPAKRAGQLSQQHRDFLERALRVNHAGELAATLIYTAQTPIVTRSHPHLRPLMKQMYDQEAGHFETFKKLLAKHRVRPTAMYPVWKVAASVLGWSTGVMGREAAMACTEAVETEIGSHYNGQVRILLEMIREIEARGEPVGHELRELVDGIRRIRDEELEHLDHAVDNDAKQAEGYGLLTGIVRGGCRAAIWVTERV
ncbi:MAG: hypothetical protein M1823_001001 [Watsoniomyces obsoletus]|nr:MAG: hypothetical protein M1823_001001 [Watsoniomyces obsoletus]